MNSKDTYYWYFCRLFDISKRNWDLGVFGKGDIFWGFSPEYLVIDNCKYADAFIL